MAARNLALALVPAVLALAASTPARAAVDGKEFYDLRCATCHGMQGQGTKHIVPALAPALKGNPFITQGSEAAIRNVIRKGRAGAQRLYNDTYPNMPAFGPEAVPDVAAVIAYMKGELQR